MLLLTWSRSGVLLVFPLLIVASISHICVCSDRVGLVALLYGVDRMVRCRSWLGKEYRSHHIRYFFHRTVLTKGNVWRCFL
uniref:Putative secreted protein n=1 Tax=Ixodes ricinus TaxID=34613 RepID=A0A6B0U6L5_IXORI